MYDGMCSGTMYGADSVWSKALEEEWGVAMLPVLCKMQIQKKEPIDLEQYAVRY